MRDAEPMGAVPAYCFKCVGGDGVGVADYIIIAAVAAALGAAITHTVKKRWRGDCGCGGCMGDCSSCMHASHLDDKQKSTADKEKASAEKLPKKRI